MKDNSSRLVESWFVMSYPSKNHCCTLSTFNKISINACCIAFDVLKYNKTFYENGYKICTYFFVKADQNGYVMSCKCIMFITGPLIKI